jgi:hypothetical protein
MVTRSKLHVTSNYGTGHSCHPGDPQRRIAPLRIARAGSLSQAREPSINDINRIGMDTSKSVFQLHGVDAAEQPALRKKLRRRQLLEFFARLPARVSVWDIRPVGSSG